MSAEWAALPWRSSGNTRAPLRHYAGLEGFCVSEWIWKGLIPHGGWTIPLNGEVVCPSVGRQGGFWVACPEEKCLRARGDRGHLLSRGWSTEPAWLHVTDAARHVCTHLHVGHRQTKGVPRDGRRSLVAQDRKGPFILKELVNELCGLSPWGGSGLNG
jgi:hypothetical protein